MKRVLAGMLLATMTSPVLANEVLPMTFACPQANQTPVELTTLSGVWDMIMEVRGNPSFGLITLGRSGADLAGSIAMNAGAVVVRSVKLAGDKLAMVVATTEGDVKFDGRVFQDGRRACGIVTYHDGQQLNMIMQKRPDRTPAPTQQAASRRDER